MSTDMKIIVGYALVAIVYTIIDTARGYSYDPCRWMLWPITLAYDVTTWIIEWDECPSHRTT